MFIDKTYFQGDYNIPSLQAQSPVLNSLNLFIQTREPMYLKQALGYSLWKSFIAGLAEAAPEARWIALRDGADYTDGNGILRRWEGFKNAEKQSPIVGYVYYWFVRDAATYTTSSGEVVAKNENSANVGQNMKSVKAYNDMVAATHILHDYLSNAIDDDDNPLYPEYDEDAVCVLKPINIFNL